MGDSACLMHSFPYASAFPNESIQRNPMHALTESISFGRFMTEPLSWEKWSAFSSHQKYVEEAASYARKGSVAQKKAFFEAHYKRIAAQKAPQENKAEVGPDHDIGPESVVFCSDVDVYEKMDERKIEKLKTDDGLVLKSVLVDGAEICEGKGNESLEKSLLKRNSIDKFENQDKISNSENSGISKIDNPLLKDSVPNEEEIPSMTSKKRSSFSSLKSSFELKTWKTPSAPLNQVTPQYNEEDNVPESKIKTSLESIENKRSSPNSPHSLMSSISIKQPDQEPVSLETTPLKTTILAPVKNMSTFPAAPPISENRRMKKDNDPSVTESRTGSRWHIFSAIFKSTPILRKEERAVKRKQKHEEKFNANEVQKVNKQRTLKEKAGNEFRKLSWSLCFSARPSPHVDKDKDLQKIHTKRQQQ